MWMQQLKSRLPAVFLRTSLLAVAAVQAALIAGMVWERATILRSPTVVEFDTQPVDPRSLFRGDYVTLSYPAGQFQMPTMNKQSVLTNARWLYVTLARNEAGEWRPVAADVKRPASVKDGELVLRALADPAGSFSSTLRLKYGIETYFVPEGTGRAIEDAARDRKVRVRVAVGSDGKAAIKGLIVDGEVIEEPVL